MQKIKIGVVGCGRIFLKHYEAINFHNENYELVALCDTDDQALSKYENNNGIRIFKNYISYDDFFCSLDCKNKYGKDNVCDECGFGDKHQLIKPIGEDFLLCNRYPNDKSCYHKYIRQKYGATLCSLCRKNNNTKKLELYYNFYYCENCFEIYKNIVTKLDYNNGDKSINSCQSHCVFCNYRIRQLILCICDNKHYIMYIHE